MICPGAMLKRMKKLIDNGADPNEVIPWSLSPDVTEEEYIEILYFASQVLPEGRRKESVIKTLKDIQNASR